MMVKVLRIGIVRTFMVVASIGITLFLVAGAFMQGVISVPNDNPAIVISARPASANNLSSKDTEFITPTPSSTFFVLVIGNDERPGVGGARADAIHLLGINPEQEKVTILNFPRDTTVSIPGHGRNKINAANAFGGSALTVQTLEQLTGVSISYVLEANFAAFSRLVDDLGGIDVTVEKPMHDHFSGSNFDPGVVHMTGVQALNFSRDRHTFAAGDITRSENQGKVLIAALAEMKKTRTSITSRFESSALIAKHLKLTNLTLRDLYFLMEQASKIEPQNITNLVVPWQGSNTLAPKATDLFADFKDNAILDTYK